MENCEIDALIAEKVMGWKWVKRTDLNRDPKHPGFTSWTRYLAKEPLAEWQVLAETELPIESNLGVGIPEYSTDISAAWLVVEKIKNIGTRGFQMNYEKNIWWVGCVNHGDNGERELYSHQHGEAETLPLAICLAALKAVGHIELITYDFGPDAGRTLKTNLFEE